MVERSTAFRLVSICHLTSLFFRLNLIFRSSQSVFGLTSVDDNYVDTKLASELSSK